MDDLTKIEGIGPATEKKLQAAGIASFAALAAATPDQLNAARVAGNATDWAGFIAAAASIVANTPPAGPATPPAETAPATPPAGELGEPKRSFAETFSASQAMRDAEDDHEWTTPAGEEVANRCRALAASMGLPLFEVVRQALELGIAQLETPVPGAADGRDPVSAEDMQLVVVTGPAKGRWRGGRHWTAEAKTLELTQDEVDLLRTDPAISVVSA